MVTVAQFDGIDVIMYVNDHAPPHFHVRRGSEKARIDIATGRVLRGKLRPTTEEKVRRWTDMNCDALMAAWMLCRRASRRGR